MENTGDNTQWRIREDGLAEDFGNEPKKLGGDLQEWLTACGSRESKLPLCLCSKGEDPQMYPSESCLESALGICRLRPTPPTELGCSVVAFDGVLCFPYSTGGCRRGVEVRPSQTLAVLF